MAIRTSFLSVLIIILTLSGCGDGDGTSPNGASPNGASPNGASPNGASPDTPGESDRDTTSPGVTDAGGKRADVTPWLVRAMELTKKMKSDKDKVLALTTIA